MEILLWLVPAALVTLVATAWVSWWGREGRGRVEADREAAARRLGEALERAQQRAPGRAAPRRTTERSSGVALRPSKARPVVIPGEASVAEPEVRVVETGADKARRDRRAS